MMLLALDSATRTLSLALHDGQRIRAELTWETANAHTVELTPAVAELLRRAALTVIDLTHLAVAQGPGSFSGLRIGIGFAKGLALALAVPLIAVPTLDIVAGAQPPFAGTLLAVAQAGRGRVCAGRYTRIEGGWQLAAEVEIASWPLLLDSLSGDTLIAGEVDSDGRALIEAAIESGKPISIASAALCVRRAAVLADLAWARADGPSDPAAVAPLYVNQPGLPHPQPR